MWGWIAAAMLGWLLLAVWTIALLAAAKRGDAAIQAHTGRRADAAGGPAVAESTVAVRPPPAGVLDALARAVREELAVDQVLIVVRDEYASPRAVAVAVAGLPAGLLGRSLGPRDSLAAAVALSGHAVIAPDHGPLTQPGSPAAGDAAAVPLSAPAGAIAIARLRGGGLTADDLQRLRAVLRRHDVTAADPPHTRSVGDDPRGGWAESRPDRGGAAAPRPAPPRPRSVIGRAGERRGRLEHVSSAGSARPAVVLLGAGVAGLLLASTASAGAYRHALSADGLAAARIAAPGVPGDRALTVPAARPARDRLLPAPGACPDALDATAPTSRQRAAMLCLIDLVRARAHRRALAFSRALMRSAALKRRALEDCGAFTHTACGEPFTHEFELVGYLKPPWRVGENLAWGSGYLGIAYAILDAWLHSPHHRANLLEGCWHDQGISVRWVANWLGRPIAALWVSHFGTHS
jgi:uncharacterized protein YkwD